MDRWFSDVARTPASAAMPMDLFRDGDVFVARIDLPGVDPASIDVDVDDRTLTVRAQRNVETTDEQKWLVRERPAGTFARQLTLGYGVALDKIGAEYADGVLSLRIPVAEEAKPRKISVSHSGGTTQIEGSVEG
jgi:HSP20 family protein